MSKRGLLESLPIRGKQRPILMHIREIFSQHRPTISFEFFPPKTEKASQSLYETIAELEVFKPSFVSVTYGAGGTTRDLTHDLVLRIKNETPLDPIPHLTCVCHQEDEIEEILTRYAEAGVSNILALGGDPPRNIVNYEPSKDAFQHAADLVRFIRKFNESGRHPHPEGFGIGVAGFPEGHPGTPNRLLEMEYLKAKVDTGADYICTQLFFDNHDFFDYRDRCELAGIDVPDEVAVIGAGNEELPCDMAHPTLSSVALPIEKAGHEAAAMLDALIQHAQPPVEPLVFEPVGVVPRQSTNIELRADPEIAAMLRFIREHAHATISVEDVMESASISRRTAETRFRALLGRSPLQEIRRVRIERAKQLLADSDLSLSDIATGCGFASAASFGTLFRKAVGVSPGAYRLQRRAGGGGGDGRSHKAASRPQ